MNKKHTNERNRTVWLPEQTHADDADAMMTIKTCTWVCVRCVCMRKSMMVFFIIIIYHAQFAPKLFETSFILCFSKTIHRNSSPCSTIMFACIVNAVRASNETQNERYRKFAIATKIHSTFNQLHTAYTTQTKYLCQIYCVQTFAFCPQRRVLLLFRLNV